MIENIPIHKRGNKQVRCTEKIMLYLSPVLKKRLEEGASKKGKQTSRYIRELLEYVCDLRQH